MLKRLFCCLSLLLSLCLLFPVFSISISAISVDGYEVSTYVDTDDLADFVEFENTIVLDSSSDFLLVLFDIEFPEVISKDTVFDLEVSFSLGDFESIEPFISGSAYDAAGNELNNDLYAVIEDGKLIESDIVAEGDIKSVRYVFVIYNPIWQILNTSSSSEVEDLRGTTWLFNDVISLGTFDPGIGSNIASTSPVCIISNKDKSIIVSCNTYQNKPKCYVGIRSWVDDTTAFFAYTSNSQPNSFSLSELSGAELIFYDNWDSSVVIYDSFKDWLKLNATLQGGNSQSSQYSFDFAVTSISLTQEDDTGLIAGIFGWIKKIFNAIRNLPNQIGDLIKGLFVPSEEAIIELKDKFEALLADRFGAAYQSIEVVDQFGQAMGISTYSDTKSTLTIPSVSVPLAGTVFTFGGWEVDIVPKGFESLVISLKLITDLVCTVAFLNALRRRMEAILR